MKLKVGQVSRKTGLTRRTIQYYDRIGLLSPRDHSDSGYRLYDEKDLERLAQIMLFRELEIPLRDIKEIMGDPDADRNEILHRQKEMLLMKREHLDGLIRLADEMIGGGKMDFKAFDRKKMEEYAKEAKSKWGSSREYSEYEEKSAGRSAEEELGLGAGLLDLFRKASELDDRDPSSEGMQKAVGEIQKYITDNFYTCTDDILASLGQMYVLDERFKKTIDGHSSEGTAEAVSEAIKVYVEAKKA